MRTENGEQKFHGECAGVAELADARDLKSRDTKVSYRFDPGHRHHRGLRKGAGKGRKEKGVRERAKAMNLAAPIFMATQKQIAE